MLRQQQAQGRLLHFDQTPSLKPDGPSPVNEEESIIQVVRPNQGLAGSAFISTALAAPITTLPEIREF